MPFQGGAVMGSNGSKGGFHEGTRGSPQGDLEQETLSGATAEPTAKDLPLEEGIRRLSEVNANFTPEDTIFVIEDPLSESGLTWLEQGNEGGGLQHILYGDRRTNGHGHAKGFLDQFGIEENDVPSFLKEVILNGTVVSNELAKVKNRMGYERIYEYKGKRIIFAIGTNGFITTAYYKNSKKGDKK